MSYIPVKGDDLYKIEYENVTAKSNNDGEGLYFNNFTCFFAYRIIAQIVFERN